MKKQLKEQIEAFEKTDRSTQDYMDLFWIVKRITTQGDGFSTTMGGVDEEQIIKEELSKTPEAKNVRATDAYTILMKEFGGLR